MPTPPAGQRLRPSQCLAPSRLAVRSFNQDKPYDRFVKEQVAGDEMDPDNPRTSWPPDFCAMGPWEQTGMSVFKKRQMWLDAHSLGGSDLPRPRHAMANVMTISSIPSRPATIMNDGGFLDYPVCQRKAPFLPSESKLGFAGSVADPVQDSRLQPKELAQKIARLKKAETGNAKVGITG